MTEIEELKNSIRIEKLRERTRKNWKRETRSKFWFLMDVAKHKIKNATSNYCVIERSCKLHDYFALWLVSKKLEAKGFKCELERGKFTFSGIFYYDKLTIEWE